MRAHLPVWLGRALLGAVTAGVVLASVGPARADVVDEAWKQGNDAFFRRDYAAAIAAYEQIDSLGLISNDLYYNLGNAYYWNGSLGRAVWAYERGLALEPKDEDARFNLAHVRKIAERRARDRLEGADRDPLWMRVVTALTTSTETWLFVVLYVAVFAALIARRSTVGSPRVALGAGAAILAFGTLCAGGLLAGRAYLDRVPFGIVLPDQVAVKEGADVNYRTSFELHAGLRVRLLERDQEWVRIRLANGLDGWVRDQDLGRL